MHSVLKSRDITLSTKIHIVKAMFFPVVMVWIFLLSCPLPGRSGTSCHGSYKSGGGEKRFRVHSKGEYNCRAESGRRCIVIGL